MQGQQAVTRFSNQHSGPKGRLAQYRGAGTLAAVSGGLFGGRARPEAAVLERLSGKHSPAAAAAKAA